MPTKTKKYREAVKTIQYQALDVSSTENADVYEALEEQNYFWSSKKGTWEYKKHTPSTSVFQADDGEPTGIIKLRVMSHPDDLREALKRVKQISGLRIIEISEKTYPNRKGSGVRKYVTALLEDSDG
ncbi:MAG: hypothetical protein AAFV93_15045 [Chloroflexota bacterium]